MALTFGKASGLEPELRLVQVISEFEADLSDEQKTRFRKDKSQSPHPDDVMRLTAEIDRSMLQQGRRCYGTRLTKFLQGVQRFASIGDVLIGGSQYLPACGVWTLVRFSLLSIVQYKSYVDGMSQMFMEIGRSAPSYERMALLYPHSKHLQANVLEYFILVVRMCHRMLKYSKSSSLKQFFEGTYHSSSTDRTDLEKCSLAIRDEMHIAMASANQKHFEDSSTFRTTWKRDVDQRRLYRQQTTKFQVFEAISSYDYLSAWTRLKKVGSTTVLTRSQEYTTWKQYPNSGTLILLGQLGAGKSIVLANMVDDLFLHPVGSATVAYFFCDHDILQSLMARTIAGAITRQLLKETDPSTLPPPLIHDHYSVDDFILIISELLKPTPTRATAYIILDGIHECDGGNQSEVFAFLAKLQLKLQISVCISTQAQQPVMAEITRSLAQPIYIRMPRENPDIELYIEKELESLLESGKLAVQDPNIVLEIRDMLMAKSEGMFLWVYLQILLLRFENSDDGIRQILNHLPLPKDLAITYARLLDKTIATVKEGIRTKFLDLVVAAFRPLTVRELQESLSVTPGDTSWNASKLVNDLTAILSACSGLIVLDEEQETVRLVHTSAFQFLRTQNKYLTTNFHETMVSTISTYLQLPHFETSISSSVIPTIDAVPVPIGVITSTLGANTQIQQMAIKLLKSRSPKKQDVSKTLAAQRSNIVSKSDFHFQHYAREYWLRHLCEITHLDISIRKSLAKLIESKKLLLDDDHVMKHVSHFCDDMETPKLLCMAVERGCVPLVVLLLDSSYIAMDNDTTYPLKTAILLRNKDMVSVLLKSNKVRQKWPASYDYSPLEMALNQEWYEIATIILQHGGGDPNEIIRAESGQTHLLKAVNFGNVTKTRFLLECAQIDMNKLDSSGFGAVHYAVRNNDGEMLALLLSMADIDVNAKAASSMTPLHYGIHQKSNSGIISMLLSDGRVNPDIVDDKNRTALHVACVAGNLEMAKVLLSNTKSYPNHPALELARKNGDTLMVRVLLSKGRHSLNARDKKGKTALHLACRKSRYEIVTLLLSQEKLDPNIADVYGRTALHIACCKDDLEMARLLLSDVRLHPDATQEDGRTSLQLACSKGNCEMVELLLSGKRVDINKRGNHWKTALYEAVEHDRLQCVDILFEKGAFYGEDMDSYGEDLDPNIICSTGIHYGTPLHRAVLDENVEMVRKLLSFASVDPTTADRLGPKCTNTEIIDLLIRHRAEQNEAP